MNKITGIILLLSSILCNAQDIAITKSEIFKDSKRNSSLEYSLEDGNGGVVTIRAYYGGMRQEHQGYYIQHFDSKLNLLKEIDYEARTKTIRNAFIKDNRIHLIEYQLNGKDNKISFSDASADLRNLEFSTKEFLSISEENQKKYFGFVYLFSIIISDLSQQDDNHAGEVVMSANNNFFVINFDINNKDKETHKVFVFNSDFDQIYEQVIQKDIKDKYFEYNSIDVDDNDGTVYFLGKSYENESRKSKKNGKANYHYEIYKVNPEGQRKVSFKNNDKFISSLEIIKSNEKLACVGFYGLKGESRINGVSLFNLDSNTLQIQNEKFTPFSEQFLKDKYGDKVRTKERNRKKGIKNIDFKNAMLLENGDMIINAEEFYITFHSSVGSNGMIHNYTVYHYNDIISLRINGKGELIWARNINKNQTGVVDSSYTSITTGEDSYFFINCSDNIKRLGEDRIAFKQTKSKKSNLYVIKIGKNGKVNFNKLIDDKDSQVYYKVNEGIVNLDNKTVFLVGERKKNSRILKLKI